MLLAAWAAAAAHLAGLDPKADKADKEEAAQRALEAQKAFAEHAKAVGGDALQKLVMDEVVTSFQPIIPKGIDRGADVVGYFGDKASGNLAAIVSSRTPQSAREGIVIQTGTIECVVYDPRTGQTETIPSVGTGGSNSTDKRRPYEVGDVVLFSKTRLYRGWDGTTNYLAIRGSDAQTRAQRVPGVKDLATATLVAKQQALTAAARLSKELSANFGLDINRTFGTVVQSAEAKVASKEAADALG